jgi:hypothetical protein
MPYTATQTNLIKQRLRAYFYAIRAEAEYRFGWRDLSALIFDYTQVQFLGDSLRAIARGQISRGKRRGGGDENLEAIVTFLTHPDINALSLEELKEPDIPYLFAMQLIEFLKLDEDAEPSLPPPTLEGAYRALSRPEDGTSESYLEITLSKDGRLVHLQDSSTIYRNTEVDPAELSDLEKKRHRWRHFEGKGWGIVTPEDNLLGFMRPLSSYGTNRYYGTIGNVPGFTNGTPIERLVLLGYDEPYFVNEIEDSQTWNQKICRNVLSNHVLQFVRIVKEPET